MNRFVLAAPAAAAAVAASPANAGVAGVAGVAGMGRHDGRAQVNRSVEANRDVERNIDVRRNLEVQCNVQVSRFAAPAYGGFVQARRSNRGERFDRRFAPNYQVIQQNAGLYAAPRGHQWVRSGSDAVLVSIAGELVGALIANLF